jgi:hypothetical protein
MRPETWIAIYAAIVATSALLLNFRNWLDARPRLHLSLIPDGLVIGGDPRFEERNIVILTVTNRGREATMITNMVLFKMDTRWRRWRKRPSQTYVIPNPQLKGYPENIPADLEPAKKWTGVIRERLDIIPDIHNGTYFTGVYASHRDKPYLAQIPKRTRKAAAVERRQATKLTIIATWLRRCVTQEALTLH